MSQYRRNVLSFQSFEEEPGLGAFAAAFATFKGDEKSQGIV